MRTYRCPVLVDQREPAHPLFVAGELGAHVVQMAAVDLVDDLKMARQQRAEETERPLLQGFGQKRVIGVGECVRASHSTPSSHSMACSSTSRRINSATAMAGWVSFIWMAKVAMQIGRAAGSASLLNVKNVLQGARDEEELLGQPQLLALDVFVIGIEDLGDVLGRDLVRDRTEEIARVEGPEVEGLDGLRRPQAHGVGGVGAVAENRRVVGNAAHHLLWNPAHAQLAVGVVYASRCGRPS